MSDVCLAIDHEFLITFEYAGLPRVVEPYIHGRSTTARLVLRGFQVAGRSRSRSLGWKLFSLDEMRHLNILDVHFVPRPEYVPGDRAFDALHCAVIKSPTQGRACSRRWSR